MAKRFITPDKKECSNCLEVKDVSFFYKRSDKRHLFTSRCKKCITSDNKESSQKHKDRFRKQQKEYHKINRERRISYLKKYQKDNLHVRREKDNERRKNDPEFRLTHNLRSRIGMALKRNTKSASTGMLIGCSIQFLKDYIENKFQEGMSWDNYGKWQIDHIIPCSKFDLSKTENQLICFNYKNLQPLWAIDNLIKKDKIEKEVCHR